MSKDKLTDSNQIEVLMQEYEGAINSKNMDRLESCFHPDYYYQEEDIVQLQTLGLAQGVFQSRAEYIRSAWEGLSNFSVKINYMIQSDNRVFVSWTVSGIHTGYFHKLPPSNKEINYRTFSTYKIKDSKIIQSDSIAEWLLVLNQIGKAIIESKDKERVNEYLNHLRNLGFTT